MSSWKKASKAGQKFHKERGQIKEREFLGILEKKKDYKLRALDFQKKRDAIKNVKRKIQEKNPDEFYFNMVNTKVEDGIHQLKTKYKQFTDDEIKLMKSQDKNYIRLHQQIERKKIEKMQSSLHLIDVKDLPINNHRFYVDNSMDAKEFDPAKQFNTHEALLTRKSNRLTTEQLESIHLPEWIDDEFTKAIAKRREKKYKELASRIKREKSLRKLEETFDLKMPQESPEDDYDEKYHVTKSSESADNQIKKYEKCIPRKR